MDRPWLKFYGDMPHSLNYPTDSMVERVFSTAKQYPQYIAYDFMGNQVTYGEFTEEISRVAASFVAMGIKKGDHVTICLPNIPQGIEAFYALNKIGAIPCMVHPLSAPEEISYYLKLANSTVLLTLDIFSKKIATMLQSHHSPCQIIVAKIQDKLPTIKKLFFRFTKQEEIVPLPNSITWSDFLKNQAPIPMVNISQDDCAVILYSGGTTGTPKGICLSNLNFNALAMQTIAASGCVDISGTAMLSVMPLFHGFGLGIGIHTALVGGAKCILVPRFTIDSYAKLLKKKKPNFIPGVPTLFAALLQTDKLKNTNLSFLKGVFSGGDSLSPDLKKRVDRFLKEHGSCVNIREGYGTTECVTASCLTPTHYEKEGSIGIPYPDMLYKIVEPSTQTDLPCGKDGEICIAGPTVMLGYLDDPIETEKVIQTHADGVRWLHTGDLGQMDQDGYVYFRQRIKRVIVSNGYNIYPTQIEKVLSEHPKVDACCVVGVKDEYRGQRVRAYVVLNGPVEKDELLAYCRRSVAKYALPKEFIIKKELPKTAVGKVAYRILEEEANHEIKARSHH
ncbi:MAG: acyl--CoA ligase [Clostridia bacterium]|nr:acyl--CoA ligase [Clostridia bacterium]